MTEPPIAPLARRLAEENNVEWRTLQGSGDGGSIGERDVLNYLEQVMIGAKPVAPTPEPLPEGVEAWAEEAAYTPPPSTELTGDVTAASPPVQAASTPPGEHRADNKAERGAEQETKRGGDDYNAESYRTLAAAHRAALAELEATKPKLKELEAMKLRVEELETLSVKVEQLGAREAKKVEVFEAKVRELEAQWQGESEGRRELVRLREGAAAHDKERVKLRAFEKQVGSLKASLANAQRETQQAQETTADLTARLGKAEAARGRAEAETEGLRAEKSALEAELDGLRNRPWWKVWG